MNSKIEKDNFYKDKRKGLLTSRDNKSYEKAKYINANRVSKHNTFTQKKIYQKKLYGISLKKASQIKPFYNYENETQHNIKIDEKILSSVFKFNFDNSIEPPNLSNETVLNFHKFSNFAILPIENIPNKNRKNFEFFPPLFQHGAKYIINDIHSSLYNSINYIIKLQSYIRAYLVKKKLIINNLDKSYFEKKSIMSIIKLQKNIRGFLARKNIRKMIIIKHIYQKRKKAAKIIIKRMKIYLNVIKIKKILFINHHIKQRKQKAKYIQEIFRNYRFYKSFKKLKKDIDKSYFLYYPYKGKKVQIIIYFDEDKNNKKENIKYSFAYNKLLKYYILLINPCNIFSGKYKCQFVVNDIIIFDNRYPTIKENNNFYNIIDLIPRYKLKCKINQMKKIKKIKKIIKKESEDKNSKEEKKLIGLEKRNSYDEKKSKNNTSLYLAKLRMSLEDIKEEDDEGRSVTSKDINYDKRLKDLSDISLKLIKNEEVEKSEKEQELKEKEEHDNSFDFTEEEYLEIKKIKNKNFENSNFQNLKNGLNDKKPINKIKKVRKTSLKNISNNK